MAFQNLHLRSNVQGKEPVAGTATGQLPVGSIGINFNADEPFLTIQDSAGAIRRIAGLKVGTTAPATPTAGETWLDTTVSTKPVFKVHDGTAWQVAGGSGVTGGGTAPAGPSEGDLWVDTSVSGSPVLMVYNGTSWAAVFPDAPDGLIDGTVQYSRQVVTAGGVQTKTWEPIAAAGTPDKIEEGNTKAEVIDTGTDGSFAVTTEGTQRLTVNSAGRLLVGTSSAASNVYIKGDSGSSTATTPRIQLAYTESSYAGLAITSYTTGGFAGALALQSSDGALNSNVAVVNNQAVGIISFNGNDGTNFIPCAEIKGTIDGTPGTNDMPGRLVFSTTADGASSPTERMRVDSSGRLLVGTSSADADTGVLQCDSAVSNKYTAIFRNSNITPYGIGIKYTAGSPNGSNQWFLFGTDSTTTRFYFRSDGGLGNYSANNVNLSDRNVKKDIAPAAGTWDCLKAWEIVNYRYKDQPDDADLNMGVIAQQIAESCPEVITVFQAAKQATKGLPAQEERIGVKEQQMVWMAIKALQEAMERIEQLEAKVNTLEGN
jgi:hypothetical protein